MRSAARPGKPNRPGRQQLVVRLSQVAARALAMLAFGAEKPQTHFVYLFYFTDRHGQSLPSGKRLEDLLYAAFLPRLYVSSAPAVKTRNYERNWSSESSPCQ